MAQPFELDPIKHPPHEFCVVLSHPPSYPPILVEQRLLEEGLATDASLSDDQPALCNVFADGFMATLCSGKTSLRPFRANVSRGNSRAGLDVQMSLDYTQDHGQYSPSQLAGFEEEQFSSSDDSFVMANEWPNEKRPQVLSASVPSIFTITTPNNSAQAFQDPSSNPFPTQRKLQLPTTAI